MAKRKVLIPLDGSEFSRQILHVVRNFFEPDDVELIIFRAAFPPVLPSESVPADMFIGGMPLSGTYEAYNRALDSTYAALEKEREQYRAQLAEELEPDVQRLRDAGYTARGQVDYGEPAQCIIDYVQDAGVDMVAMATHGRGGLGRLVLGSVAERVLRSVGIPVLLMRPQHATAERPAAASSLMRTLGRGGVVRVAAATDGSPAAQHAVELAGRLSELLHTQLHVLVVASDQEGSSHAQQVMNAASSVVGSLKPRPEFTPLVGYIEDVVADYLEKNREDLLVIGPFHDRGAGSQAAIGPAAQRVVQQSPVSTLVVKGHRQNLRRVLILADVDDDAAVTAGTQMAALLGATVDVVHILSPSAATYLGPGQASALTLDEALAQGTRLSAVLQGWIDRLTAEGFDRSALHLQPGNMPEAALELANSGRYDLAVVGSRSSAGHFHSSAANNIVRFANCSVLLVRNRE